MCACVCVCVCVLCAKNKTKKATSDCKSAVRLVLVALFISISYVESHINRLLHIFFMTRLFYVGVQNCQRGCVSDLSISFYVRFYPAVKSSGYVLVSTVLCCIRLYSDLPRTLHNPVKSNGEQQTWLNIAVTELTAGILKKDPKHSRD